jgi:hypothetical protein
MTKLNALNANIRASLKITNTSGVFLIIRINIKSNPISLFIFYNSQIRQISKYKIYYGKSYYKNFTNFIRVTLKETNFKGDEIKILAPKYFINPLLIDNCKNNLNILLVPYSLNFEGLPLIISEIKKGLRFLRPLNKEIFEL